MKALQRQKGKEKATVGTELEPSPGGAPQKVSVQRSVRSILEAYQDNGLEGLVLSAEEIGLLIDSGVELDEKRKAIMKEVDNVVGPTKKLLLALAERDKWKRKSGKVGDCKIGAGSSTVIDGTVTQFAALLKKEGKLHLFDDLVNIKITDTKKYLGEDALKDFMHSDTKEYGTVSLSKKK